MNGVNIRVAISVISYVKNTLYELIYTKYRSVLMDMYGVTVPTPMIYMAMTTI